MLVNCTALGEHSCVRALFLTPSRRMVQGSGLSDGEYVTLGAHEVEDLQVAVDHIRQEGLTSTVGLWGRSMGAVTALLYSQRDPSIAGVVRPLVGRAAFWRYIPTTCVA